MIKENDMISVRNRNNGDTGYILPDRNLKRLWAPNETKKVPFEELRAFSYTPGALYALNNLFVIEDKEALDALNMQVEPEYYYTEEDIRKILLEGTIDQFADFLDFAPEGCLEIAKTIAIKEEIPDIRKRDMISKKTGLNINNAIMVNHVMEEGEGEEETKEEAPKQRRALAKEEVAETPQRRTSTPNYKIVKKG